MPSGGSCVICSTLPDSELVAFNLVLADPQEWPRNIFDGWTLPKGTMPAKMRNYGGIAYGKMLLAEKGLIVSDAIMKSHFKLHVPHFAVLPADVEEVAKMALSETRPRDRESLMPVPRPRMFTDYYMVGIQLGTFALEELRRRVEAQLEKGEAVDDKTLWQLAKLGESLAKSQAGFAARHAPGQESDDELKGFRDGSAPLPSERLGDHRIRVVGGVTRAVVDRGKADRDAYNDKAAESGSPRIGGR